MYTRYTLCNCDQCTGNYIFPSDYCHTDNQEPLPSLAGYDWDGLKWVLRASLASV